MKIAGTATMQASRDQAWAAFHDPRVLARTIPGVQRLTETGEDAYDLSVTAGVAAIKGTYDGTVALTDQRPKDAFTLRAQGSGAPGTIGANVAVSLSDNASGGTDISYDADAIVGGAIGGVGQRMLAGVGRKMAGGFFAAIDKDIASGGAESRPVPSATDADGTHGAGQGGLVDAGVGGGAAGGVGTNYAPLRPSGGALGPFGMANQPNPLVVSAVSALLGAGIALAGVALGRRLAR